MSDPAHDAAPVVDGGPPGPDALIDAFEAAWSGRDGAGFSVACAPDLHYEDPLTPQPLESSRALARHAQRLWAGFPDARMEATGPRMADAEGRWITAPVKLVATHRGELEGLPPTGRFVIVHAVFVCRVDDTGTRLGQVRGFFDVYDAAVQLGVLPKPGTMGERALLMLRGFGLRRD